jgi:hypothetical protein
MKILYLDDEEGNVADYRRALRERGHVVKAVTSLQKALETLMLSFSGGASEQYDIIIIDLMLLGQNVPYPLTNYYNSILRRTHNEGQAIGQWLWEKEGASKKPNRPIHFYFSNVPTVYSPNEDPARQEFGKYEVAIDNFSLHKIVTPPSQLPQKLEHVFDLWRKYKA